MPVSGISASRTFNQKDFIDPQASHTPASQSAARVRRSTAQDASNQEKKVRLDLSPSIITPQ
ncbi:hypothetical protein [Pseudomonas tolaasii]|uniref:hypothetical protein n=1 Tax=Pseudomonas tolaasii TaxID=29442 RepID=UPI0012FD0A45|nr:hypothetical protein [Pseudomonas tolaasii]